MRKAVVTLLVLAAAGMCLAPMAGAEDADGACAHWHYDIFDPDYVGPVAVGIECRHTWSPLVTWTVPEEVVEARFYVFGADDSNGETSGGFVKATLDVIPGSVLTLEMGGDGEASAVKQEDTPLLVAGGGKDSQSNYVLPAASLVQAQEPGAPAAEPWDMGRIGVEWHYFREGPKEQQPDEPEPPDPTLPSPELLLTPAGPQSSACVVPRLKGLRPIAARKALLRANCTIGRVVRRPAKKGRRGDVVRQAVPAGAILPAGAPVDVTVGRQP